MLRRGLFVALLIAIALAYAPPQVSSTSATAPAAASPVTLVGDSNCDGFVNEEDVLTGLSATALGGSTTCDPYAGDANCDGREDIFDPLSILGHLASVATLPSGVVACEPGQALILGAPTESLIDDANLDADTALIYKTFAFYNDDRLPPQYMGDSRLRMPDSVLREAHDALDSMSPADQALLAPYFIPPAYEGSWTERIDPTPSSHPAVAPPERLQNDWSSVAGNHIRVWYSTDDWADCTYGGCTSMWSEAMAKLVVGQEAQVWDKLTLLMNRDPLSDEQLPYGGGDGKLDVFLVVMGGATYGSTTALSGGGCHKSVYIELNQQKDPQTILDAFAHEFMHAIQFAFSPAGCRDMDWWAEATANYAIHYVYPNDNLEHRWARQYLFTLQTPIEEKTGVYQYAGDSGAPFTETGTRNYGASVFPLFMDVDHSDPGMVRRSWEASESQSNSLAAINGSIEGGFKERWPEFAVQNWNANGAPMVNDFSHDYARYDKLVEGNWLHHHDTPDHEVRMDGMTAQTYKVVENVPHLAQIYRWYEFKDPNVKQVGFFNEFPSMDDDNVRVQAMVKIAGQDWKLEDWSKDDFHSFCRERDEEKVEELVIVVSNATYDDRDSVAEAKNTRLSARSAPCSFYGTASLKYTVNVAGMLSSTITNSAEVYWDVQGDEEGETKGSGGCLYLVDDCFLYYVEADVNWTYSYKFTIGSPADCADSNGGSEHIDGTLSILVLQGDGAGGYTYSGAGANGELITGACESYLPINFFNAPQPEHFKASENNNRIKGQYIVPTQNGQGSYTWNWDFRR